MLKKKSSQKSNGGISLDQNFLVAADEAKKTGDVELLNKLSANLLVSLLQMLKIGFRILAQRKAVNEK
jgi:hypothetical protein